MRRAPKESVVFGMVRIYRNFIYFLQISPIELDLNTSSFILDPTFKVLSANQLRNQRGKKIGRLFTTFTSFLNYENLSHSTAMPRFYALDFFLELFLELLAFGSSSTASVLTRFGFGLSSVSSSVLVTVRESEYRERVFNRASPSVYSDSGMR